MAKREPELPFGVRLLLAYDGTEFHGWQAQPTVRTVQQTIEEAIDAMGMKRSRVRGCSRTDAGVHAEGQVAAFSTNREIRPRGWTLGLNGLLPPDVSIKEVAACHRRYEPRFDADHKLYRYLVCVGRTRDPLSRRHSWYLGPAYARRDRPEREERVEDYLDVEAMRDAAKRFVGHHDFRAFRAADDQRETTDREMRSVQIIAGFEGRPNLMAIEVDGTAFMKNTVRIMAGTLVEIGRQRMAPQIIDELLQSTGDRRKAGPTAPAHGLTLIKIWLKHGDRAPNT